MPVFKGSRYAGVKAIGVTENGITKTFLGRRKKITLEDIDNDFFVHTVQAGDNIDAIAYAFGGKARLWWIIADLNNLEFPVTLEIGKDLIIPNPEFFRKF